MVDAISNVTQTNGGNAAPLRTSAAPAADTAAQDTAANVAQAAAPISPHLTFDAISGAMITEFIGSNGEIHSQVPSTAALAYLRAGLNAQGQPEVDPNAPTVTTQPTASIA